MANPQNLSRDQAIKTELIDQYVTQKDQEKNRIDAELQRLPALAGGGVGGPAQPNRIGNQPLKNDAADTKLVDTIQKGAGYLTDLTSLVGVGNTTMKMQELAASDEKPSEKENNDPPKDTPSAPTTSNPTGDSGTTSESEGDNNTSNRTDNRSDREKLEDKHKGWKTLNNYISLFGYGLSGVNNVLGMYSGSKKLNNSKNSRVRTASKYNIASNAFGLLGNASKFISTGIATWGDLDDTHQDRSNRWMGLLGSVSGTIGSIISARGSFVDREQRNQISQTAKGMALGNNNDQNNSMEDAEKRRLRDDIRNSDMTGYQQHKTSMNALKAKKYAMQQAAELNQIKADQMRKGVVGSLFGSISSVLGLVNAIPAWRDSAVGGYFAAAGGAASALGTVVKQFERISDKHTDVKMKEKRNDIAKEYLDKKAADVDAAVNTFESNHPNFARLTPKEKRLVAIGRMGIDVDMSLDPNSQQLLDQVFEKVNHKRALNIALSDNNTKTACLTALKLDPDASIQEIEAALRGD